MSNAQGRAALSSSHYVHHFAKFLEASKGSAETSWRTRWWANEWVGDQRVGGGGCSGRVPPTVFDVTLCLDTRGITPGAAVTWRGRTPSASGDWMMSGLMPSIVWIFLPVPGAEWYVADLGADGN